LRPPSPSSTLLFLLQRWKTCGLDSTTLKAMAMMMMMMMMMMMRSRKNPSDFVVVPSLLFGV
jgi:hypothetical protein